jgi:carboxypeptidase Taq
MNEKLQELKARLMEINDLKSASALLVWDQETYMPPGGAPARARQAATLERLAHEKLIDPALGKLLADLHPYEESLPYESDEASLIRVARRDFEKAVQVPPSFTAEFTRHMTESYQAWAKARPADDFAGVRPYLEKTLDLSRQYADYFPGYEHIADPLIDVHDEGMTVSTLRALFAELRQQLVPLVQAITAQPLADDSCLRQHYPETGQWALCLEVARGFGYDTERGRQDKSPHPFTINFSIGDVRYTVRVKEDLFGDALFSAMHEGGHALYEQGIHPNLEGTPLGTGTSSGVHESQSRLWENIVGRGRHFWQLFYPRLQEVFPRQLGTVPLETFYRAINKVEPSLIRTDADEVTYNLHVMLRFDFELALLEGRLAVKDLPEAWRERLKVDLGVVPPDDRDGVLQDVHWFSHAVGGMFQGYTLGNILSTQFYQAALQAHPEIPGEMERGDFGTLLGWLRQNIYQHGRKFTADELVERVTGGPMSIEPYMRYLRHKYGELYALPAFPASGSGFTFPSRTMKPVR